MQTPYAAHTGAPKIFFILTTLCLSHTANPLNPRLTEIFTPHHRNGGGHGTAFNEGTMITAYNCDEPTKQEVAFLDPTRCKKRRKTLESVIQQTVVFIPTPDEHEMSVCEASLSIVDALCGFANLQYQNIMNNDNI